MKRPLRCVVISPIASSLLRFRGALLKAIHDAGLEVLGVAPEEDAQVRSQLEAWGGRFCAVPMSRTGKNPLSDLRLLLRFARLFREERPDLLLSYTIKPIIYGSLAARLQRVPSQFSMVTGAGYAFLKENWRQRAVGALVRPLYRLAFQTNRKVFFLNPDDQKMFSDLGLVAPSKTLLLNGEGIDLAEFPAVPPVRSPVVFLMIGRLYREKGIVEYVEAARLLKRKYPGAIFRLIAPSDPNPSALDPAWAEAQAQAGVVEYTRWVDDVRPALAAASVFVLPSYREGTSRAVLEALATGRAVVTTDAPGCREPVSEGVNGYLVPVKDPQRLAAAMECFILHPELVTEFGQRSRALAESKYDVRLVNRTIMTAMGLLGS